MIKLGIMGGTFDPIHYGHLFIAGNACDVFELDKVLFIPTGTPPHKDKYDVTDKNHRYNMTKLAISDNEKFDISSIEIDREFTCYTADTIDILDEIYKSTEYYYIVGTDVLRDIPKWKDPERFLSRIKIVAADRLTDDEVVTNEAAICLINDYNADVEILNLPLMEISSTDIRNRLFNNRTVRYMLPDCVVEYINQNNLYKRD